MKLKKSSFLLKIMILALAVYAAVTMLSLQSQIEAQLEKEQTLQQQVTETQQKNQHLQDNIDSVGTTEGVESIAHSKLGLVSSGEIVFEDVGD